MNGYLGYLAPFLEKQFITISYNFEITQPHKPRKMQNLQFFQLLKALESFYHCVISKLEQIEKNCFSKGAK